MCGALSCSCGAADKAPHRSAECFQNQTRPRPAVTLLEVLGIACWRGSLSEMNLAERAFDPGRCPAPFRRGRRVTLGCKGGAVERTLPIDWVTLDSMVAVVVWGLYPLSLVRALRELRVTMGQLGSRCWIRYIFPAQHRPQLLEAFLAQAVLHVAALLRGNFGRNARILEQLHKKAVALPHLAGDL